MDAIYSISGSNFYSFERGEESCVTSETCAGETRKAYTYQNIGLIYPSDYVYTYALNVDDKCFDIGYSCSVEDGASPSNGWLMMNTHRFLQSPTGDGKTVVWRTMSNGRLFGYNSHTPASVQPALYLKSNVQFISGNGSKELPYTIE